MKIRIQYKKYKYNDIYSDICGILLLVRGMIQVKLFDEIKPVFFIDNKMNNILNDINVNVKTIKIDFKILDDSWMF